jgi:uncharacterized membrane protein
MSVNGKKWEERRERALLRRAGSKKRGNLARYIGVGVAVTLIVSIAAYYILSRPSETGRLPSAQDLQSGNNTTVVTVPVSDVGSSAKYYTYDSGGTVEKFFLVKGTDGNIHAAMDACDVCYPAKKGYKQSGDRMVCNNCGKSYSINSLGTDNTAGGCWPSHIPMTIANGYVTITKADLDTKVYLFK